MESFTLMEKPNTSVLGWVAQHPEVWREDVEPLREYARQCLENDGKVAVEYQRKGLGRFYVADTHVKSCTTQWRKVRSTLFHENHIDLDIISCHPRICRELLNRASIDIPLALESFCVDKDAWLATQKLSKDQAKALFCALINGGSLGSVEIRKSLEIPTNWVPCQIWLETAEALTIAMVELFQHPETKVLLGRIAEARPDVEVGIMHKSLAHVYQYYETQHMIRVMGFLEKAKVKFSAYCYDGCVIHKDYLPVLLRWINSGCKVPMKDDPDVGGWGSVLQFKIKAFGEYLQQPNYDFSDAEFMRLAKPDTEDEAGCKAALPKLKLYYERHWCLVDESQELVKQTGPGQYMRFKGGDRNSVTCALQYPTWIREGKEGGRVGYKPWFNYWLKDCTKRKADGWDYAPPPRVCKPNHLDLWTGFEITNYPSPPTPLDTSVIKNHIKYICEDSQEGLDYMIKWLAWIFQKPGTPTGSCIAFIGDQGTGKSEMWKHMMDRMMGEKKISVDSSWDNVFGRFNIRAAKSFIVCDEMEGFDSHKGASKMKSAITETTMNHEQKGKQIMTIPAACNFIIATNERGNIAKIEESDRRYTIFDSGKKKERAYYDKLFDDLHNKAILRSFYDELMAVDLVGFDPQRDRVLTEAYNDIKELNTPREVRFVQEWQAMHFPELNDHEFHSVEKIYLQFREWCEKEEFVKVDLIPRKLNFAIKVKKLLAGLDGVEKVRTKKCTGYSTDDAFYF